MGYFQVRYDSGVVIYNCRGFIRLATDYYLPKCTAWAVFYSCLTRRNVAAKFLPKLKPSVCTRRIVNLFQWRNFLSWCYNQVSGAEEKVYSIGSPGTHCLRIGAEGSNGGAVAAGVDAQATVAAVVDAATRKPPFLKGGIRQSEFDAFPSQASNFRIVERGSDVITPIRLLLHHKKTLF